MNQPKSSQPSLENPPIRDVQDLASATECTGLIPTAVRTENQADNYARLYAIHNQKPVEYPVDWEGQDKRTGE